MSNLLKETIELLKRNGKTKKDIICVSDGKNKMSWELFKKESDFSYDDGFGSAEINMELVLIGKGFWLERHEYDGAENWLFKTMPKVPDGVDSVCIKSSEVWEYD